MANHDEALEEVKRVKKFMEGKGVGVRAFWAIEAGAESGTATIAFVVPERCGVGPVGRQPRSGAGEDAPSRC